MAAFGEEVEVTDGDTRVAYNAAALRMELQPLVEGLDPEVRADTVVDRVTAGLPRKLTLQQLDDLVAETAAYLSTTHPDYGLLGGRVLCAALRRRTPSRFSVAIAQLRAFTAPRTGEPVPLISDAVGKFVAENADVLDAAVDETHDRGLDFFGFKTLERSYLLRGAGGRVVERPQYMYMRCAVGLHCGDIAAAVETYGHLARGEFVHASPTLFNAGTPHPQLSSCYLVAMQSDSIDGIYRTLHQCAMISKAAGGIGLHIHNVRASGSYIRGTNGTSNGLVPMLRVFSDTARYVDQGGGKRKGAIAVYLEPWHADIFEFLDLKKPSGKEELRARDLFFGLWVPDLFLRRVLAGGDWSLFCPAEAPGLADVHSAEFDRLYERYESEGRARRTIRANDLFVAIVRTQLETGGPYMLYKDACNAKSNHQHLGAIKCSNLCTEIVEYSSPGETAVCNLASMALPKYIRPEAAAAAAAATAREEAVPGAEQDEGGEEFPVEHLFDFDKFAACVAVVVRNLNKVIDVNDYPTPETRASNLRHRPMGIGIQGLADVFATLALPFTSRGARALNRAIFEAMYFAALRESCALARRDGPHPSYAGSPMSRGELQMDLWAARHRGDEVAAAGAVAAVWRRGAPSRWDWEGLRAEIAAHGVRNSLLVAPMPTASTSQILGNCECFEPFTSNLYVRRVLAGEFCVVNRHLVRDLRRIGVWSPALRAELIARGGSVQGMAAVPAAMQAVYQTAWEVRQRGLIEMAADRGWYIDQSQSLNLFLREHSMAMVTKMHVLAWTLGLKTGMYYLRTRPAADPIPVTVSAKLAAEVAAKRRRTPAAPDAAVAGKLASLASAASAATAPAGGEEAEMPESVAPRGGVAPPECTSCGS